MRTAEIYLDLTAGLNFLVDLLLMMAADRLAGFPRCLRRLLPAAALGGIYSGVCLLPGFSFLGNGLWRTVVLGLMCLLGFGWDRSALRRGAVFLLLSMALGGMAMGFRQSRFSLLVPEAILLFLLCRLAFGGQIGGREYVPVTLSYGGQQHHLTALRDTGNSLRDPLTGEAVLVISRDWGRRLLGLTPEQLADPMHTLCLHPGLGLRLIPFHTVGGSGMMLALPIEKAVIGNRKCRTLVAFSPQELGRGQLHQALTGGIA